MKTAQKGPKSPDFIETESGDSDDNEEEQELWQKDYRN